ncbi:alpha/beta hydrolase [Robertkochia marina]|uniref:Alpha/beta hydrolase n=1 Tax=Robertkochia marina TaxID=1227945 RepID=A0A4S3LZL2_9FLAO|nr:dienelactone hydrolase family protein [Robertkochia marina]THD66601.1 alpha/beta hydrolase [Robertkochia marina]TRZ45560.1 alpha/beta hydrolase [Robertkochia marina]
MKSIEWKTDIPINLEQVSLKGRLQKPENARGLVVFSHGSGSSRLSSRNNYVASALSSHGFATLLFDLLTEKEDRVYSNRFDIDLLTGRLLEVTAWLKKQPELSHLAVGYFGASTGAASALKAAAVLKDHIKAVVSRGGRPDLASDDELKALTTPVLLIVGGFDTEVISLNREAFMMIRSTKHLEIVANASHLFEEPGKLQEVTDLSINWFDQYLKL